MKMKTVQKAFWGIIAVLLLVSTNSCENTEIAELIPSMKATVNGEAWNSVFRLSTVTDSTIVVMGTPTASEKADKTIILTTLGTGEGSYYLTPGSSPECTVVYKKTADATDGGDDYYVAYEANIVISKLDEENKKISGTFNAKLRSTGSATDEVIITDGSFENLLYQ